MTSKAAAFFVVLEVYVRSMHKQRLRLVEVIILADDDELPALSERIGAAICQPSDHDDPCVTPWTLMTSLVEDLDEPRTSKLVALASDD
ncbi:MAG: hypothetical protein JWO63_3168 [Frankiales bacterium]|nr:hypothetical protein [Frankiales bacterium]